MLLSKQIRNIDSEKNYKIFAHNFMCFETKVLELLEMFHPPRTFWKVWGLFQLRTSKSKKK
jgi:hypothetical protein